MDGGDPPDELRKVWMCKEWRTLPKAGGLDDQDYAEMTRMTALNNIYNTLTRMRNAKDYMELSKDDKRLIGWLKDNDYL